MRPLARPAVRSVRKVLRGLGYCLTVLMAGYSYLADGPRGLERLILGRDSHQTRFLLRLLGANIGAECDLESPLEIHHSESQFSRLTIGYGAHVGKSVFIDLAHSVTVGVGATISMRCMILTHIDVGKSPLATMGFPTRRAAVVVEDGAYLGAGAIILPGVTIGRCAVVGAGAVVNRDVEAGSVCVGVPARLVRRIEAGNPNPTTAPLASR